MPAPMATDSLRTGSPRVVVTKIGRIDAKFMGRRGSDRPSRYPAPAATPNPIAFTIDPAIGPSMAPDANMTIVAGIGRMVSAVRSAMMTSAAIPADPGIQSRTKSSFHPASPTINQMAIAALAVAKMTNAAPSRYLRLATVKSLLSRVLSLR